MALLSLTNVSLAYGHRPLLAHVDFHIEQGERVCLIGRNGTGKSTLFKVITGMIQADEGEIWRRDTLRISYLEQEVPAQVDDSIFDIVAGGLGELGQLLRDYHHALHHAGNDNAALQQLTDLQQRIEVLDGWNVQQKVESVISRLDLEADRLMSTCSGGMRRRVMLARALVSAPDLLLLDEPTNHMDITSIAWVEEFLKNYNGGLIFITHDRTFLRNLATRIIELDRGKLSSFPGNYDQFLQRKAQMLEAEIKANERFDKQLAEHEAWVRQGVKARRTRANARVNQLLQMRAERGRRINVIGKASMQLDSGELSGKLVNDLRHVNFSYNDHPIIQDLSTRILRGDRIGIIGPNGSGKSTLLKIILGELKPDSGQVVLGTRLETAYFDQHRELLQPDKSVRDNMSEFSDYVNVKGKPRHVISYLREFLFPPDRIDTPVRVLSGGERNRLMLAKLFTQSANLLVLDEPTNDLDVETLELLEDLLSEFEGTLLLVSHDRTFLDNVVTSTLVFEGHGVINEYVGGYEDWLRQRRTATTNEKTAAPNRLESSSPSTATPERDRPKLTYKEKRELESLPGKIEQLEIEQAQLQQRMADPVFYSGEKSMITATLQRVAEVDQALQQAYARWESLEQFDQ